MAMTSLDPRTVRAFWWSRQGLDGSLEGKAPAQVLERSGWARSVGGCGPYLSLFARSGASRASIDQAVADRTIHELPSARGCTYVVPARDFALALTLARIGSDTELKQAMKLGVTEAEIGALEGAVLRAVEAGPLTPEELREVVGPAARSLGPEGAKKGLTTTLPVALGRLQVRGELRRIPTNGRLDQQRYRYAAWSPSPLEGAALSAEEAATELARRYFRWVGPATAAEFQWFSGLGKKAAAAATAPLGLVAAGEGGHLLFPEDLDALRALRPPAEPRYALVSSLDAITAHRRNVQDLLDLSQPETRAWVEQGRLNLGGLADLPSHALLDRGELIGLWEYDPDTQQIAWRTFQPPTDALQAAIQRTATYVREELGDARSFSLDSPRSRAARIEGLRG